MPAGLVGPLVWRRRPIRPLQAVRLPGPVEGVDSLPTLRERPAVEQGVTSALAEVECLRTLDRLVVRGVLARAAQPFPLPLGTLDAIHLATALLWRERGERALVFSTHDAALGLAARASGFEVAGTG